MTGFQNIHGTNPKLNLTEVSLSDTVYLEDDTGWCYDDENDIDPAIHGENYVDEVSDTHLYLVEIIDESEHIYYGEEAEDWVIDQYEKYVDSDDPALYCDDAVEVDCVRDNLDYVPSITVADLSYNGANMVDIDLPPRNYLFNGWSDRREFRWRSRNEGTNWYPKAIRSMPYWRRQPGCREKISWQIMADRALIGHTVGHPA